MGADARRLPQIYWPSPEIGGLLSWLAKNRWELLFVGVCTAIAAFLRVYRLAELPPGLHGDEALTGLDALRIVNEGWIGPYVGSALGQTTGPFYLTAFIFKLAEPTLFTVRLSMAILGIATVPLAYLFFRVGFGRWVAVFATIALVFEYWHLYYSRTAFPLISMPLMTSLGGLAVLLAIRSARRWPWFVTGLVLGAGVYTYGVYPFFLLAVAIVLLIQMALCRVRWREHLVRYSLGAFGFVLVAIPMIQFAITSPEQYFGHTRIVLLTRDPQFVEADNKAAVVAGRVWDAATLLIRHPHRDGSDASGGRGTLSPALALLAYAGLVFALMKWRSPPHLLAALAVIFGLAVISYTAINWGDMRRSILAVPFVYGLAGIAAQQATVLGRRFWGSKGYVAAMVGVSIVLAFSIVSTLSYYFGGYGEEDASQWTFAKDFIDGIGAAHGLGDPGIIYFYSARMSYNYETRQYLYPDTPGVDRSREFGAFSLEKRDDGPVTYLFFPPYTGELEEVKQMYPGGTEVWGHNSRGALQFGLYRVDEAQAAQGQLEATLSEMAAQLAELRELLDGSLPILQEHEARLDAIEGRLNSIQETLDAIRLNVESTSEMLGEGAGR